MASSESRPSSTQRMLVGAGIAAAAAGAFLWRRAKNEDGRDDLISDAPPHVLRGEAADRVNLGDEALVGRTVTIDRPRHELFAAWRDFSRFPSFMDNVEKVEKLDDKSSRWTIKAPAGNTVGVVTRIVEEVPGRRIAWESEPGSDIDTAGQVEFLDAPPGRGTHVRLLISYDPPGGIIGRGIAKLLQREPSIQARRDLRRFKQLMETGEVTSNASPSGRESETPTEARI